MSSRLNVPRYSYEDLRRHADSFLERYHPTGTIPIPIEVIVECDLGIHIVPIPGLHDAFGIDAFVSSDLTTISVDEFVWQSRENRYRFSLAHETGHVVLHGEIFRTLQFGTIEQWKQAVSAIHEEDYEWLEWHGYNFAGLVLVPRGALASRLAEAVGRMTAAGLTVADAADVAKQYVAEWLGKQFVVSPTVIEKRLDKDGLWPPG